MKKVNIHYEWLLPILLWFIIMLFVILTHPARGEEISFSQPPPSPPFSEFKRWFGPAPKGNERTKQLFDATSLLLKEMEKEDSRDLESAAETIRCKFTPDQWQDVLSVAFSYKLWQEIYLLRCQIGEVSDYSDQLAGLENNLKLLLQKVIDGQNEIGIKLNDVEKNIKTLADKLEIRLDELITSQLEALKEISFRTQIIEEVVNDNNNLLKGIDGKVDRLLEQPIPKAVDEPLPEEKTWEPLWDPVWPEETPKSFWIVLGVLEQQRMYANPFGFIGDSAVWHSWPNIPTYLEVGTRKFFGESTFQPGVQFFVSGGMHKTLVAGPGGFIFIRPLGCSLGIGGAFLSENLRGNLKSLQFFGEITIEKNRIRFSLRAIPKARLAQAGIGLKF